jgi:hypothetical protein
MTINRDAADILKQLFAVPHIGAKGRGRLTIDPEVISAVARQFMAIGNDASNHQGMSSGKTTQGEKRRSRVRRRQDVQKMMRISLDPRR